MNSKFKTKSSRLGFTLVELLLVIAIIAIIASLGVGVMAQAQNDAAIASTRSRISLIEKILEIELENYEVRRSPIPFAQIGAIINDSTLVNPSGARTLLHAKNLKRMIIADLIRAEMPDGSVTGLTSSNEIVLGQFPSQTLADYLATEINLPNPPASYFPTPPASVTGWLMFDPDPLPGPATPGFCTVTDITPGDGIDTDAANKSEFLYQILLNINVDGVPAIDQIGSQAIGDTDSDGVLEVLDAWGEPLFLQWQQEQLHLPTAPELMQDAGEINANVWDSEGNFVGLSREHVAAPTVGTAGAVGTVGYPTENSFLYSKPVLPTQIRPFLISERLLRTDGLPTDYDPDHAF